MPVQISFPNWNVRAFADTRTAYVVGSQLIVLEKGTEYSFALDSFVECIVSDEVGNILERISGQAQRA